MVYGNTFSLKWNSLWRNGRRESTKVKNGSELKIKKVLKMAKKMIFSVLVMAVIVVSFEGINIQRISTINPFNSS